MKILVICPACDGLDMAIKFDHAGHDTKVWFPKKAGYLGQGMVNVIQDWRAYMKWAELIVITYNSSYVDDFEPYFKQGFPIFGCNRAGLKLEADRGFCMDLLKKSGCDIVPFQTFTSLDKGMEHVLKTNKAYACKPLTDDDRGMSYVANDPADMYYKLGEFKTQKLLKKGFILQEKIDGIEMAVGGWCGPAGFSKAINENWEEKRLMNDGLGINTGEQGTILHYTTKSELANKVLLPLEDYLVSIGYVGYFDINCMVSKGNPYPLEATARFGWPHYDIVSSLHEGDPAEWMAELLAGKDKLKVQERVAAGVVLSHGDYPYNEFKQEKLEGVPIYGITSKNAAQVRFIKARMHVAPAMIGGKIKATNLPVTHGDEVLVVTAQGETVQEARDAATDLAWNIKMPTNRMFRTDIGKRLEEHLPKLQSMGFAKGVKYG